MSASYLGWQGFLCSLHDAEHTHTHTRHRQTHSEGPSGSVGFGGILCVGTRWQQTDRRHEKKTKRQTGKKRKAALVKNDTHIMTHKTLAEQNQGGLDEPNTHTHTHIHTHTHTHTLIIVNRDQRHDNTKLWDSDWSTHLSIKRYNKHTWVIGTHIESCLIKWSPIWGHVGYWWINKAFSASMDGCNWMKSIQKCVWPVYTVLNY